MKSLLLTLLIVLLSFQVLAAESDFPVPENIKPAIEFWVRVYSEVDTSSGFLHDSQDLGIVYQSLARDRATINSTRKQISEDLTYLSSGARENLSESQARILSLWPSEVSNERLATAAGNVRWQLGQSNRFVAGLKRSGAYREHIERVVLEKGMPIELAVLPHVESSFHPGAYSSAAASGMWQFVRATAARFMQVDYVVDERLDPYIATFGAMELLEYNYSVLGTWPLALTAYNHGVNGMARAVRAVGTDDIGRIIDEYKGSRFGFASRNFYPQFLAVQEVERRADEFYGPLELDPSPNFQSYYLNSYIDAVQLANSLEVSLSRLERDNPALQPSVWSGTKRVPAGFTIKINRSVFDGNMLAVMEAIPESQRYSDQIPDVSYIVSRGDSLSAIADRFSTSISELVAINQLRDRNRIRIGQTLLLPQPDGTIPSLIVAVVDRQDIPENGNYEVKQGDSISLISERFQVPEETLLALNSLNNQGVIFPGQLLNLKAVEQVLEEVLEQQPEPEVVNPVPIIAALAVEENQQVAEDEQQLSADLATDPADYTVAGDQTVEIQAVETLGHYADWLDIRAQDLRVLNSMPFRQPLLVGNRIKLDFSKVDVLSFENKRKGFHRDSQAQYFSDWRIRNTEQYSIRNRDYLVNLTRDRSVPMWLFKQYNPEVDTSRLRVGQVIVFPVVERVEL